MNNIIKESYTFNSYNKYASNGITEAIKELNVFEKIPIVICVGSDLVLGDSLGPLVGTFLKKKNIRTYIYGNLSSPITAKEVNYAGKYLKEMHPNSLSIVVDAAIGESDDIGLVRVLNKGIKPGQGVNKDLDKLGDIGIIGIVASKSIKNYNLFNLTRLNLIYKMAETISDGIYNYIIDIQSNIENCYQNYKISPSA